MTETNFTPSTTIAIGGAAASRSVVTVTADGKVMIDWPGVEEAMAKPIKDDIHCHTILRALIAVRDGTWTPMGL